MPDPFLRHLEGATVAVTGASGNLGTALLRRLTAPGSGVAEVRGLARRRPPDTAPYDGVRWYLADLGEEASEAVLAGSSTGRTPSCTWPGHCSRDVAPMICAG